MPIAFKPRKIHKDLRFLVQNTLLHPTRLQEERVQAIWEQEKQVYGEYLFDGWIFSATCVAHDCIEGQWVRYRYALAGYRDPALGRAIGVLPVAINGLSFASSYVLLGKRAKKRVASFPGLWELAPSGGLDRASSLTDEVQFLDILYKELAEETGILPSQLLSLEFLFMIEDPLVNTLELCIRIELQSQVLQEFTPPLDEYTDFLFLPCENSEEFLAQKKDQLVPLTAYLLTQIGSL